MRRFVDRNLVTVDRQSLMVPLASPLTMSSFLRSGIPWSGEPRAAVFPVAWAGFAEFRLANPSHEFKDDAAGPTTLQVGKVTRVREYKLGPLC